MAETAKADVTLVIIDDHADSLELLSAALQSEGVRIFTAQLPEDGLEIVLREHPQIVLTDLVMPGLSGLDVLDGSRWQENRPADRSVYRSSCRQN